MDFMTIETLLLHYACGALGPAEGLIAAAHVSLNHAARRKLAEFEAFGGRIVQDQEPVAVKDACLAAVMARISAMPSAASPCAEPDQAHPLQKVPCAIKKLLMGSCEARKNWRQTAPGQMEIALRVQTAGNCRKKLRLFRLDPAIHFTLQHKARLMLVVLAGEAACTQQSYATGDIILAEPDVQGKPASISLASGASGCTVLTLAYPTPVFWMRWISF